MVKENKMKITNDFSLWEKNCPWLRKILWKLWMIFFYGNKISNIHLEGLKNKIFKIVSYELLFFTIL
jgi:hypothetical protein